MTTMNAAPQQNNVMPGLVPGIHGVPPGASGQDVDGRDKPGHDVAMNVAGRDGEPI